jgi:lambda repressor-like predicted transcriptional regulator
MSQTDRPSLTLEIECQIEAALNQIHTHYWPRLEQMQEFTGEATDIYRRISPGKIPQVPIPRSPNALKLLLGQYAAALFESEATYYPDDPELAHWLKKLGERVTSMVLDKVAQVEHAGSFRYVSLSYHNVRLSDMQKAIGGALSPEVTKRFVAAVKERVNQSFAQARQRVLDAPLQTLPEQKRSTTADRRKAFISPLLLEKGWSILQWATEAEVAYNTVADYLSGKKNPYPSTRVKLAKALGISANRLPQ